MGSKWVRRPLTVVGVSVLAALLVVAAPVWVPGCALYDLLGRRPRLPTVRLVFFALLWSWLEVVAVAAAVVLWVTGQGRNRDAHYALQRWWSARIIGALRVSVGLRVDVDVPEDWGSGPYVALCRHASLGDAIMSCWVLSTAGGLKPRYVLKKELKTIPTLDIFGHRLPNYFVDRASANVSAELTGIEQMAAGLDGRQVAVIFPEGSRVSGTKRTRELERLGTRNPARAARLATLRHLLPPKSAGAAALLSSVPGADVLVMWHTGFDGLDTFRGILERLRDGRPRARMVVTRWRRDDVDMAGSFSEWLDERWLEMDEMVARVVGGLASAKSPVK